MTFACASISETLPPTRSNAGWRTSSAPSAPSAAQIRSGKCPHRIARLGKRLQRVNACRQGTRRGCGAQIGRAQRPAAVEHDVSRPEQAGVGEPLRGASDLAIRRRDHPNVSVPEHVDTADRPAITDECDGGARTGLGPIQHVLDNKRVLLFPQ